MSKIFQPRDNLNQNSKFGNCCGCPSLMSDGHLFTNWVSSRIYNDEYMKNQKINGSHSYRNHLQRDANTLIDNEYKYFKKVTCTDTGTNKFYIDSSKYGFDYPLNDGYWGKSIPYYGSSKIQKLAIFNISNRLNK
jgi:archaellin